MFGFRKKSPVESGAAGEPERDYTVFAEGMQQFWRRRLPGAELGQDGVITVPELGLRLWQEFTNNIRRFCKWFCIAIIQILQMT